MEQPMSQNTKKKEKKKEKKKKKKKVCVVGSDRPKSPLKFCGVMVHSYVWWCLTHNCDIMSPISICCTDSSLTKQLWWIIFNAIFKSEKISVTVGLSTSTKMKK